MKGFFNYFTIVVLLLNAYFYRHDIPFDSNKWKNWAEKKATINNRWDMRNDLILNYGLVGMTQSEVVNLLGEPRESFKVKSEYIYFLGMARFGIDTGSLTLKFKNGKVSEVIVWRG
ncbi:MAG TPA: hypothetical protein VKY37_00240 [Brumimicrobium sp.]|nr:hypothetical protein [Brumimicrobium sp.]